MSEKKSGCLPLVLFLALCVSLLINVGLVTSKIGGSFATGSLTGRDGGEKKFDETTVEPSRNDSGDKIALLEIRGIISSGAEGQLTGSMVDDAKVGLRQATADDSVRAIVLHIDSPGGEVTASDVIYNEVRKAREKKPVVVYMGSLAASGGYYISCGGSYLLANETTITGSIGVILETLKYKDLMGKIGVEPIVFKSGKFKDILSGARDMTPEEQTYIQGLVMQTYDKFVGIVAAERQIPEPYLRSDIADGRIISGKDAVGLKLINGVGYIEDAYNKARELGRSPNASVVRYEARFKLGGLLRLLGSSAKMDRKVEISLASEAGPRLESGKLYLLPSWYAW